MPRIDYDLTKSPGWPNLAPGNHTIKIVAKGTVLLGNTTGA